MVSAASVFSFGVRNVFWSILHMHVLLVETDGFVVNPPWARWIVSSVLLWGYFGMYTEEVLTDSNSLGHFILG